MWSGRDARPPGDFSDDLLRDTLSHELGATQLTGPPERTIEPQRFGCAANKCFLSRGCSRLFSRIRRTGYGTMFRLDDQVDGDSERLFSAAETPGIAKKKVLPLPAVLSTQMRPP